MKPWPLDYEVCSSPLAIRGGVAEDGRETWIGRWP